MDYRILGPLEVVDAAGRSLPLGGAKQRALLALLLLHANQVLSADRLIDELWGVRLPRTAAQTLQVMVWRLRKLLPDGVLVTRAPGYALLVAPGELDLFRFEALVERARGLEPAAAASALRDALELWRGSPLADVAGEEFAQTEIARLEELQLSATEQRIDAELALGRHAEQVAELTALAARHPFRERLRGQVMLALYRCGRRADALEAYRQARTTLVDELGLEPGDGLRALHSAMLQGDASLDAPALAPAAAVPAPPVEEERSILVTADDGGGIGALLALVAPLAASPPGREVILTRLLEPVDRAGVAAAARELDALRGELTGKGVRARAAAFTSPDRTEDLARLASTQEAELLLLGVRMPAFEAELRGGPLAAALGAVACDAGLCLGFEELAIGPDRPVLVPFGAGRHDWGALELGAWVARAHGAPLRLMGALAGAAAGGRDASRLLADASLLVQRWAGIAAEPVLAAPGLEGVGDAARGAGLLVVGLSDRWEREGLGATRSALAARPPAPTLFVRRGLRPGGLAPPETRTRFTWSVAGS